MSITSVAKAHIFIGSTAFPSGQIVTPVLADYTSEATYVEIGQITTIGDFGDMAQEIKVDTISDSRTHKLKGQRDAGDLTLECAFNDADTGQAALMAAAQVDSNYSFKIALNNPGATNKPTTTYFRGLVMSAQMKHGGPNNTVLLAVKISINSAPVSVAAS